MERSRGEPTWASVDGENPMGKPMGKSREEKNSRSEAILIQCGLFSAISW